MQFGLIDLQMQFGLIDFQMQFVVFVCIASFGLIFKLIVLLCIAPGLVSALSPCSVVFLPDGHHVTCHHGVMISHTCGLRSLALAHSGKISPSTPPRSL